jgi:succinoglycan biosynthesis transport protein ExoP
MFLARGEEESEGYVEAFSGERSVFDAPADQPAELGHYLLALRRNALLIALIVVPITAIVIGFSLAVHKTYRATARLVRDDTSGLVTPTDVETLKRQLATIQVLLGTPSVLADAAAQLQGQTVQDLQKNVSTSVDSNANIIDISAIDRDPRAAATIANAVATSFLARRTSLASAQLARAQANLRRAADQLAAQPGAGAQERAILARIEGLSVERASAGSDLQLAQAAEPPTKPFSPHPLRNGVFAFFSGLFLAVLVALTRDHLSPRVTTRELSRITGLPLLARLPSSRRSRLAALVPATARSRRHSRLLREAYEALEVSIELSLPAADQHVLLVTSANAGEGKSEVAHRLAEALAAAGHSTLLVSADPEDGPRQRYPLESNDRDRPSAGEGAVDEAVAWARVGENLAVLVGAASVVQMSRARTATALESLLEDMLQPEFRFVVIDGPPLLGAAHAQMLAGLVDDVLLVARPDRLTVENVEDVRDVLARKRANPLGLLVVDAARSTRSYVGLRDPVFEGA